MASEDGSGEEDKKVADMQVDKPEIEAETNPNHIPEDSVMAEKEEPEQQKDGEKVEQEQQEDGQKEEQEQEEEEEKDEEEKISEEGSGVKTPVSKKRKAEMKEATIERPSRERKTVERYTETSVARGSATKPFSIEKGKGTMLKDIPNVAFKLSKIKPDDNLQLLHNILFGKRMKVHTLKKNIGLFSGFVWAEKEEKQRAKIKERIDKCVKEKLLLFCDILNIPINKASIKKEDLSAKLLVFLESPHVTTEELLADKEMKGKKPRKAKSSKSPSSVEEASGASSKKQKLKSESEKKKKHPTKNAEEDDDEGEHSESRDASQNDDNNSNTDAVSNEECEQERCKSEEEEENAKVKPKMQLTSKKSSTKAASKTDSGGKTVEKSKSVKKVTPTKSSKATPKSTKKSSMSSAKEKTDKTDSNAASGSSRKPKVPSTKKQKLEKEHEKDQNLSAKRKTSSKSKSSTKSLAKDRVNEKPRKKAKPEPSKKEMHAVVADILKEVDFNTATLSDILKQLGAHFDIDLMHRKAEVKSIITDVINEMTDEDDDDDGEEVTGEDDEGDGENDNNA